MPPASPKIYHITHVSNLPSIITAGGLISDAVIIQQGGPPAAIGMSKIKQRRLGLPVNCHHRDFVGDYVPFYFCPRSVMLYLLYMGNHPELTYRGGQGPIVHLEADLKQSLTGLKRTIGVGHFLSQMPGPIMWSSGRILTNWTRSTGHP